MLNFGFKNKSNIIPKNGLAMLIRRDPATGELLPDTIGLSAAELLAALPDEHKSIYFSDTGDEGTKYDNATIISNIAASEDANNGGELIYNSTTGVAAQYTDGATISILTRAYHLILKPFAYTAAVFSGDSTMAAWAGQNTVYYYIAWALAETVSGIAVAGDTINEQREDFLASATKQNSKYVVVQLGLNDLDPAVSAEAVIKLLQDYVDIIKVVTGPNVKIILSQMTPARQRFIDVFGATDGETIYQVWRDVNEAIAGGGSTPITGVDERVTAHVPMMDDGSGNLRTEYDIGDHIHPNNAGRQVNAQAIEDKINLLFNGIAPITFEDKTDVEVSSFIPSDPVVISGSSSFIVSNGDVEINGNGEWVHSGVFSDGDSVVARVMSSESSLTTTEMVITTGQTSTTFSVRTAAADEVFAGGLVETSFVNNNVIFGNLTALDTITSRRISIAGRITKVYAYWDTTPPGSGTGIRFRVYRINGSNYDFVGQSELIETGAVGPNEYTLSDPIPCQVGDIFGIYFIFSSARLSLKTTSSETDAIQYIASNVTTSVAIASMTKASNFAFNLALYGVAE